MKIFSTKKIAEIDKYTIEHEPISSTNLMERAAQQLAKYIINKFDKNKNFCVIAGTGNNGGDGLAVARILLFNGYKVRVYLFGDLSKQSTDNKINWLKLLKRDISIKHITSHNELELSKDEIVIDALYGSGLNRSLEGEIEKVVNKINESNNFIISIDIPSGLMGEDNTNNNFNSIIKANLTLTLEMPKLSFFFQENYKYVGEFVIIPIFLHPDAKEKTDTNWYYLDLDEIKQLTKKREKFIEKRSLGHALIIGGNEGKTGAILLATKSCIKCGAGLTSALLLSKQSATLNSYLPEAMSEPINVLENIDNLKKFTAIGIGPGLDTTNESLSILKFVLTSCKNIPLVIDADGLNLIAKNTELLNNLPENTIITPHQREFDRLFGNHNSSYERFVTASKMAKSLKMIIVLKGAHTQIHLPDGRVYFNSTGNPGMATGGMGDVLTGIITSFLAQGYSSESAAKFGVFIHGLAADFALSNQTHETLIPSDVIDNLSFAFKYIQNA